MSNNLFMPYYRQSGLKYAGEMARKTGTADAAFEGLPMKSYFDYGINVSFHSDYPALSGSP